MRQRPDGTGLYVFAAPVFDTDAADQLRHAVAELAHRRRPFHWRSEEPYDRRRAVELVASLDALHFVVVGAGLENHRQERGRRQCLQRLLWELSSTGVAHVWLDARRTIQNQRDIALIDVLRIRNEIPQQLRVDFVESEVEPLLWLADIVAGAVSSAHGDGDDRYLKPLTPLLEIIPVQLS